MQYSKIKKILFVIQTRFKGVKFGLALSATTTTFKVSVHIHYAWKCICLISPVTFMKWSIRVEYKNGNAHVFLQYNKQR